MNIQPDFEEFLRLLEERRVEYMIVGGYAVAFHGFPRFTKDMDIFFDASPENIEPLRRVLVEFGFPEQELPPEMFKTSDTIISFGVEPVRIDLINDIDGIAYSEASARKVRGRYGRVEVSYIGLEDLIRNKRATPRAKDKADVEELV